MRQGLSSDHGQDTLEWAGVLVVVALVIGALVSSGIPSWLASGIACNVSKVFGGRLSCAHEPGQPTPGPTALSGPTAGGATGVGGKPAAASSSTGVAAAGAAGESSGPSTAPVLLDSTAKPKNPPPKSKPAPLPPAPPPSQAVYPESDGEPCASGYDFHYTVDEPGRNGDGFCAWARWDPQPEVLNEDPFMVLDRADQIVSHVDAGPSAVANALPNNGEWQVLIGSAKPVACEVHNGGPYQIYRGTCPTKNPGLFGQAAECIAEATGELPAPGSGWCAAAGSTADAFAGDPSGNGTYGPHFYQEPPDP